MTWTAPEPAEVDGPLLGDARPMMLGYLHWQRRTLLNICAGLDGEQLASRPFGTSNLSLLGLVRHLAKVERFWFRLHAAGQVLPPMYRPELGKNADFDDLDPANAKQDFARYVMECALADEAVAEMDLDDTFEAYDQQFSLRMAYLHMTGEYARHNGHADLLREAIDGATGR